MNKLVLGTAQLGIEYGINNKTGIRSREESLKLLDFAHKNGIKIFDTAHAYGDAENILGEFCERYNLSGAIKIITKVRQDVAQELNESLARLKTDCVDGCLLHEPKDIRNAVVVDFLKKFKNSGFVKNIGVSVYELEDAIYAVKTEGIDYIQVPYNIFDQRLDRTDFFELAERNNKKVFARSAFLQGLLLMPKEEIPPRVKEAKPYLEKLDAIILKYGLSRKQAAFRFASDNKNIDYVVFGVDNQAQLKEIINISNQEINFTECRKELEKEFNKVSKYIISPNLWQK